MNYTPFPDWSNKNRDLMLQRVEEIKQKAKSDSGKFLHLGCGPQILEGFDNIDKYYDDPRVISQDMANLSRYATGSIDLIYSSHALEHLPYRHAQRALLEWARVTRREGMIYLAIPDLEWTCQIMTDPKVDPQLKDTWFHYTLFGYQTDSNIKNPGLNAPEDPSQFHLCGFTKRSISNFLSGAGFKIINLYNYNGWDTPSIWVEAQRV